MRVDGLARVVAVVVGGDVVEQENALVLADVLQVVDAVLAVRGEVDALLVLVPFNRLKNRKTETCEKRSSYQASFGLIRYVGLGLDVDGAFDFALRAVIRVLFEQGFDHRRTWNSGAHNEALRTGFALGACLPGGTTLTDDEMTGKSFKDAEQV